MYRASKRGEIREVKVVKETDKSVWLEGLMQSSVKNTDHHAYCNTWEEAKQWVVEIYKFKVEEYKKYLAHLEKELAKAQNLQPK